MAIDILKICGVGLLCAFCGVIIRKMNGEFAPLLRVCGSILILGALIGTVSDILGAVETSFLSADMVTYADLMKKALGIAVITKISSDVCRDTGESAVGGCVELGGKLIILSLCLPLVGDLAEYARELLEMGT